MIEAIKKGDALAFEKAYRQSCGKVYAWFLKKTKSPDDAKDLLQITYLKLWQYRGSMSPEFLLDQHLFQIARTIYIDYLRSQNKQSRIENSVIRRTELNPSYSYISSEFDIKARLLIALSAMPQLRKRVFELNRFEGYSYREISEILSISVKAVDNNLSKALRHLRKVLVIIIIAISL